MVVGLLDAGEDGECSGIGFLKVSKIFAVQEAFFVCNELILPSVYRILACICSVLDSAHPLVLIKYHFKIRRHSM